MVVDDRSFCVKETKVCELQVIHDGVVTELWNKLNRGRKTKSKTQEHDTTKAKWICTK